MLSLTVVNASGGFKVAHAQPTGIADNAVMIGIALPLTGAQKAMGLEMQTAAAHAVALVNEAGGVAGRRLEAQFFDDACSVSGGIAAVRTAANSPPLLAAVFGHPCTSVAHAVAPLYAQERLLVMYTGALATRGVLTSTVTPLQFRLPSDAVSATVIADTLIAMPATARIGIVRDRTAFATNLMQQVAGLLGKRGRAPVLTETFAGGDKDFRAVSARIRAAGITHLAFAGFPAEALLLLDDLARFAPNIKIVATDTLAVKEFTDAATQHLDRVFLLLPPDASSYPRLTERRYARLGSSSGMPSRNALAVVAGIEVWASVAESVKSVDAKAIAAGLVQRAYPTVMGDLLFDTRGAADLPSLTLHSWNAGAWRPVRTVP